MIDKILTLHPQGKKGVNIDSAKYALIRREIISKIKKDKQISYGELTDYIEKKLSNTFKGSVKWYVVSVKLDLEARNIIERVPMTSPHELRMS